MQIFPVNFQYFRYNFITQTKLHKFFFTHVHDSPLGIFFSPLDKRDK